MLIYLHIPYCDSKCYYCSFNSYTDKFDTRVAYMGALKAQLKYELRRFNAYPKSIDTVFIGGGTPSTVSPELYSDIFALLAPYLKDGAEITTEANPNSATYDWIAGMKNLGVNRISFGVQSFDSVKLKALNRAHTPQQAKDAVKNAEQAGISNISLDIIYNHKGDTKDLLLHDIEQAFSLPINHVSAYELTIEAGTKFATTPDSRQENESLAFFVAQEIEKRGLQQYEISNFGSYQSEHNMGYWNLMDYIGGGAGAVGFLKNTRYYPVTDIDLYIDNPLNITKEILSESDILTERIFLGLRSCVGIDDDIMTVDMKERANLLCREGKLIEKNGRYFNTNYFLSDEIALYLIP